MKRPVTIPIFLVLAVLSVGCQHAPMPGRAGASIRVTARPRAGVKEEPFTRIPVYDAAPVKSAPRGQYEHVDYRNLSDIIVWLQPMAGGPTPPLTTPAEISIDPSAPSPRVAAASVGQRLVFINRSTRPMSLYSVSDGNEFDLPPIAPGARAEFTARTEGLIEVLSDPARPPVAQVYAAPSPWVVRTRANRTVTFPDLPPGRYDAVAWHPRLPGATTQIAAHAGAVSPAHLTLGVNSLPPTEP